MRRTLDGGGREDEKRGGVYEGKEEGMKE